jgi:hypothetical protein
MSMQLSTQKKSKQYNFIHNTLTAVSRLLARENTMSIQQSNYYLSYFGTLIFTSPSVNAFKICKKGTKRSVSIKKW